MHKLFKAFCQLSLIVLLFSCKSSEELIYLKDMQDKELLNGIPTTPPEYKIKVSDNLYVKIVTLDESVNAMFNQTQGQSGGNSSQMYSDPANKFLNGNIVDKKGEITLPIIGSVKVEGLSIPDAQAAVIIKAANFLKEYTVQVKMLNYKITMMGEFRSPGVYYNYNNSISILEAVTLAGNVTDFGKISKLTIIRPTPEGYKSYMVDLSSKNLMASEVFYLQPDDVVYAGPDKNKKLAVNMPTITLFFTTITTLLVVLQFFRY